MSKTQILVVDDEPDLLAELAPLLERTGFSVATASDGQQVFKLVEQIHPDLIVLDVLMPRVDGREVLRQLRQAGNWTPVILLTRVGSPTERALSLQEGADDYLNKPFEPLELIARIQAVLRRTQHGIKPLNSFRKLVSRDLVIDRQTTFEAPADGLLVDQVWGWSYPVGTRTVDTRINELRRALEGDPDQPHFIETVIGSGYRFLGEVEGQS